MKHDDVEAPLSTEEIEAILAREAAGLPPDAQEPGKAFELVRQDPGQGRFGGWAVWLVIVFILPGVVQTLR